MNRILGGLAGFSSGSATEGRAERNAPLAQAQLRYQRDRQAAIDASSLEDREAQQRERETTAQQVNMQRAIIEDEQGNPKAVDFNPQSGAYIDPDTGQAINGAKPFVKSTPPKALSEEEQAVSDHLEATKRPDTPANRDAARAELKVRDKPSTGDIRSDRSYQFNSTQLEKERSPIEAQMAKIGAATTNVNLKSPQADALLAPQILSLSAGGQGSGLRMNEAEISRILGGRTAWESLQAAVNKYSTDPMHPQIPEPQRQQMVQILQAAQAKGVAKQTVLEWAEGRLVEADDPRVHRQTVQQARQFLDAIDQGKRVQRNKTTGELKIASDSPGGGL